MIKILSNFFIIISVFACGRVQAVGTPSGIYAISSTPDAKLDYRKIYLTTNGMSVNGFFDNPYTRPAVDHPDDDPTCHFFVSGEFHVDEIKLDTWFPDKETGKLDSGSPIFLKKKEDKWIVSLGDDLPNCDIPTIDSGDSVSFATAKPWVGFAYINTSKAELYAEPNDANRTKGYLIHYDVVAVIKREGDWSSIEYLENGSKSVRWIKNKDIIFTDRK